MRERIFTISNFLSCLRIILLIPITILLIGDVSSNRMYILTLMIIAALTDTFDGVIARKLNQVTEFGKMIDPIADKVSVGVVVIVLFLQGKIPSWFMVIIVLRDFMILAGGYYIKKKKNIILQSNKSGKWAVTIIALLIIVTVVDYNELILLKTILLYLSTFMLFLSFIIYFNRFKTEIQSTN